MNQPRERDIEPPQDPLDGFDPSLNSHYGSSSSNGDVRPRRRRVHRDDLKDLRIEAPRFVVVLDLRITLNGCKPWREP